MKFYLEFDGLQFVGITGCAEDDAPNYADEYDTFAEAKHEAIERCKDHMYLVKESMKRIRGTKAPRKTKR